MLTESSIYEIKVDINNHTIHKPIGQVLLYSTDMMDRNKIIVARKINVSEFIANSVKNMGIQLLEFS